MIEPQVSEDYEVERAELDDADRPHKGEWMRAVVMKREMEFTAAQHMAEQPNAKEFFVPHQLVGERILAVPNGAAGVAFIWKLEGTKQ